VSRAEGRDFRRESLLDDFSISGNWIGSHPETGCVSAETGSNVWQASSFTEGAAHANALTGTSRAEFFFGTDEIATPRG
jgi:hypothetical protein